MARCYDGYNAYQCNSTWNNWARWLVLGLIILAALVIFFLFSYVFSRKLPMRPRLTSFTVVSLHAADVEWEPNHSAAPTGL